MSSPSATDTGSQICLAEQLLAHGRIGDARLIAERAIATTPRLAEAHRLLGLCHQQAGNPAGAETAFKAGLKFNRGHATLVVALADLLEAGGRQPEAEKILRGALESNRRSSVLVARLAHSLTNHARAAEALRLIVKVADGEPRPDHAVLAEQASAYKALGQPRKALAVHERAASLYPDSPVAHHNLAADHGDLGHFADAEQSAARALAKGGTAPQTWLVYARALAGNGRLDDAERAFREAIGRDPAYVDAHRDLAQLIWMRTEDARLAVSLLDTAMAGGSGTSPLFVLRANVLHHAGDLEGAYATLKQALRLHPGRITVLLQAAQMAALCRQPQEAVRYAEDAAALAPGDYIPQSALFAAYVAAGEINRAASLADALVSRRPLDQRALAYQATAWRLTGDPRYTRLYDYDVLVRARQMDTPDGWDTLEAYLSDLTEVLGGVHPFRTHPLDQSLRHGSQAEHLLASSNPVIRAFFQAVDGPIRRHLAELGTGDDPVRARNTGSYRFHGAWSVRLRPGGFHTDHIHPDGWLSSACYIALPQVQGSGREAWIKFGEPGIPTAPSLGPEHFIKPEPGLLVLFPSYMWHGTIPFAAGNARLSIAFDLLPRS